MKKLRLSAILGSTLVAGSLISAEPVFSQTADPNSSACPDSTCARRSMTLTTSPISSKSTSVNGTTVGAGGSQCAPNQEQRTVGCGGTMSGSTLQKRDYTCTSATSGFWSAWYDASSNCAPLPVSCTPSSMANTPVACGAGYTGTKYTTTSTNCPSGPYGLPVTTTSAYDTSGCVAVPTCTPSTTVVPGIPCDPGYTGVKTVTTTVSCPSGPSGPSSTSVTENTNTCIPISTSCTPGSYANPPIACPSGYSGTQYTTTTVSCPSGPFGSPSYSTSGYNTSGCTSMSVTCSPTSYDNPAVACDAGYSGVMYTTTTVTCPSGPYGAPNFSTSGYNISGCTPKPVPPPPPPTCPANDGDVPVGSVRDACNALGVKTNPHPRGQTFVCTNSGWVEKFHGGPVYEPSCI